MLLLIEIVSSEPLYTTTPSLLRSVLISLPLFVSTLLFDDSGATIYSPFVKRFRLSLFPIVVV